MTPPAGPQHLVRLTTYAALAPWLAGVRDGRFNLLFLTGRPGLGKTRGVRAALAEQPHLLVEGHATPLKLYAELFRHRDRPVVIDDEDSVHADPLKVRLMKCLCGTEPVKRVAWESTTKLLAELGLPTAFQTTSKVVVVTNHLSALNPHVAALFDRGQVLSFEPSAAEVHAQAAGWFPDPDVLAFFARWLRVIPAPSLRLYLKAAEMKAAGIDWQPVLARQWKAGKLFLLDAIRRDATLGTEDARAAAFEARGGGARATYYRHLAKWRLAVRERDGIAVTQAEPAAASTPPLAGAA